MPPNHPRCPYCSKALPSQNAVRLHVSSSLKCNDAWKKQFSQNRPKKTRRLPLKSPEFYFLSYGPDSPSDDEMQTIADNIHLPWSSEATTNSPDHAPAIPTSLARAVNEEVRGLRFSLPYPRSIANPIGFKKTRFEVQKNHYLKDSKSPWHPFSNQDEWELARWLINNVNQKATEKYLKLPMVSQIAQIIIHGLKF